MQFLMGGRCGGRGRRNDREVGIFQSTGECENRFFLKIFSKDLEVILGYPLGYHFGVKSKKKSLPRRLLERLQNGFEKNMYFEEV